MSDIVSGDIWTIVRDKINKAVKWAAAPVGEVVESGLYSARHYANASNTSATAAGASATNAANSASAAQTSATNAANSASAAQASVIGSLAKSANLSDLQNISTARATLLNTTALQGMDSAHGSTVFLGSNGNWNFAVGASETSDAQFWTNSGVSNGITWTKTASGVDDNGKGWATYSLSGTAAAGATLLFGYSQDRSLRSALLNEQYTVSAEISVSGSGAGNGVRVGFVTGAAIATNGNNVQVGAVDQVSSASYTMAVNDTLRCRISMGLTAGQAVNATVTIRGLQFERGSVRTAGRYKEMTVPESRAALGLGTVLIQRQVFTAVSVVDFTLPDPSIYASVHFVWRITGFSNATNVLGARVSTTAGSFNSAVAYNYMANFADTSGGGGHFSYGATDFLILNAGAGSSVHGCGRINGYGQNGPKFLQFESAIAAAADRTENGACRFYGNTLPLLAMRFFPATAATMTGEIIMYGERL